MELVKSVNKYLFVILVISVILSLFHQFPSILMLLPALTLDSVNINNLLSAHHSYK